jgi:hypothetical protein
MDAPCSGQSSDFPAAGFGLGVGPDLGCAGVGDFLGGDEDIACCRCFGLAYASQHEPVRQRGLMKAQKIRMRLGGSPSMIERFPARPKGMHWETYQQLRAAHDQAAERCMAGLSGALSDG